MFVDTHAHLYHKQFAGDREEMIQRALDAGVNRLYLPNIDLESIEPMHDLCDRHPDICFPMMGLHPGSVGADPTRDLQEIERLLHGGRYHAVGEIGIDLYWDKTHVEQQKEAFRQQVRWAKELQLPVVIHSRESFNECFSIIEDENDQDLRGVFHCFTGTVEQARLVAGLGDFYLGIGGVITYPKGGLAEVLAEVGPGACVLETDAPYLAPVPYRGKRNESSYIPHVAERLAQVTERSVDDIAAITTKNALKLFAADGVAGTAR
jgi:TatD DNase family protein